MNMDTLRKWCDNPWSIAKSLSRRGWLNLLTDKSYLSIMYRACFKRRLNWDNPKTFTEKLQWLKIYDRKPIYSQMVDKFEAKQFVSERVGCDVVVPTLGGPWTCFEEIDFEALPKQFVLKTTHDCGGVVICKDKSQFDYETARQFLQKHLLRNYYLGGREWPYKNVKPRLFAEQYLSDLEDDLKDYKFFCFNGVPKLMFVASDRQSRTQETKFDFYDMDFNHMPILNGHPNAESRIVRPAYFERMKAIASVLSQGIPHLRVDFYESNGKLYLGELTFSHWSGFVPFEPGEWDEILGSWIELPAKNEIPVIDRQGAEDGILL